MWYDETIASYGDINYKINKLYCDKNNIELIRCNERRYIDRHPAWERIPLILKYINDYDYVMWIDADAHFYIDSKNIIDLIIENKNFNFIFSSTYDNSIAINSGCFIVKNTKYSIDFLKKWGYDELLYKNNKYPIFWENGVLLDMWEENILDIKNNSLRIDYGILQHFNENELIQFTDKPFIFHLAGRSSEIRYQHSFDYNTKISI
jgi:hypothetical protein